MHKRYRDHAAFLADSAQRQFCMDTAYCDFCHGEPEERATNFEARALLCTTTTVMICTLLGVGCDMKNCRIFLALVGFIVQS